ncbi:MAG TPA: DUF4350 domain-containing protein, partial [Thermoanaerobaculia bacterium]|nr:DUF4350 domain-containing protein [Thermoanaerobaculia bacterium]
MMRRDHRGQQGASRPATIGAATLRPRWRASGRTVLLALLAGAALVAGGRLYLRYYEPEVETVEVGLRGAAAANPWLAAEHLLSRFGYPVHRRDGEIGMPPPDRVLVLLNRSPAVARLRLPDLLAWMRQGGRLIVTPAESWEVNVTPRHPAGKPSAGTSPDPLLAAFGVEEKRVAAKASSRSFGRIRLPLMPIQDDGIVQMHELARLVDTRAAAVFKGGDELGATVLVFPYGKGELTVVGSDRFMLNHLIGKHDNAAFLLWLVVGRHGGARRPPPAGVELSAYDDMPALATLLAQYAWTAVLPALLLVAALAWRAAARFGPLLPDPPDERRALLEHLEAAGRWLWHGDHGRQRRSLVEGVRRGLRERLEARR